PNYCSSVANMRRLLDFVYTPNDWSSVIENTLFAIHQGYNMYHETTSLYDIPLNHLDYQYITDCKKLKELEKILKVLRSGSEGRYPDLERHCEKKIQSIDPENRLLRKPGKLLSARQLPNDEREELESNFKVTKKQHNEKEWLNETKRQECLSNACGLYDINEDEEDETLPKVRLWGSINPDTGKGTRVKSLKTKSGKLRSYEEWDKIGKEIEKELEMDERDEEKSNEIAAVGAEKGEERKNNDNEKAVKSVCRDLSKRIHNMPRQIRVVHAQREKEKGNEALIAGDYNEALGYYCRSLVFEPTTAVYNNRALLYLRQKKWRLSVEDCNRVLEKEPENIKALLRRAQAFYELHSLVKAQKDLELVLALEPKNSRATSLLRKVREDHASRQRSNLEGGRRMVIDEVDEDEFECDDNGEDDEEEEKRASDEDATQRRPVPLHLGVEIEEVLDENEEESSKTEKEITPNAKGDTQNDANSGVKQLEVEQIGKEAFRSTTEDIERKRVELIQGLKGTDPIKLKSALDIKLDAEMLEQYIFALETISLPQGEYEFVYNALDRISKSARFNVAVLMLDGAVTKAVQEIFDKLHSSAVSADYNIAELQNQ
uniref:RNA-polymerase II-associated protein 3-like C-terminal domain-containing protein n=1 Tax=Echinococcus canadensis TaxID=519352 RepID=A0A915EX60_9CEST